MKTYKLVVILLAGFVLYGCESVPERNESVPERKMVKHEEAEAEDKTEMATQEMTDGRKLILSGKEVTEYEFGEFETWDCGTSKYGRTLVEVGIITIPDDYLPDDFFDTDEYKKLDTWKKKIMASLVKNIGFVLYDGGNTGDFVFYHRDGLDRRWDWGPDNVYSFVITPDGRGLYYDFSTSKDGVKESADAVYMCVR